MNGIKAGWAGLGRPKSAIVYPFVDPDTASVIGINPFYTQKVEYATLFSQFRRNRMRK